MKNRVLYSTVILVLLLTLEASTQIKIDTISGPIINKIPIYISDLSGIGQSDPRATEFIQVLKNDLKNAALFDFISGSDVVSEINNISFQSFYEAGADFLVIGQYQKIGDNIRIAVRLFDVKEGRPIDGRTYEASASKVREAAHRFGDIIMKQLTGINGFFTNKIALILGSGRNRNLFIMDYDGFNLIQLTRHGALVLSPHCSRDGKNIIFNSDNVWDQDLYVITLGSKIREKRLTKAFRLDQSAEWSPSGRKIAYSSKGDIYIANPDGSGAVNVTKNYAIDVSPTWSPDGSKIAFVSDKTGSPQLYVMNTNGSGVKRLTHGGYATDPSWSPNSSINKIAFVRVETGGANIYTINPDGSEEQRLTSSSRRNENPSWSPDGYYIAFSSNRSGPKEIYMMYLNGENQVKLSKGGGKSFPTWCK